MKIVEIFVAVICLNYVAAYIFERFDNGHKLLNAAVNIPNSDYAHLTKVHQKRFSGYAQKQLMRDANDLLNSYFKIGSYAHTSFTAPSPERSPSVFQESVSPKQSSIQPTDKPNNVRKLLDPAPAAAERPQPVAYGLVEPQSTRPILVLDQTRVNEMEPKPVKRPIIVVGRMRAAHPPRQHEEWRKRRKMAIHF